MEKINLLILSKTLELFQKEKNNPHIFIHTKFSLSSNSSLPSQKCATYTQESLSLLASMEEREGNTEKKKTVENTQIMMSRGIKTAEVNT